MNRSSPSQSPASAGYSLILVMILLAVLLILGVGAIRLATSEVEAAGGTYRKEAISACARATRDVFVSQLRFRDKIPSSMSFQVHDPDGVLQVDMQAGHDTSGPGVTLENVELMDDALMGSGRTPGLHPQITNDILPTTMGQLARVKSVCRDRTGRTHEVEFHIRYGL